MFTAFGDEESGHSRKSLPGSDLNLPAIGTNTEICWCPCESNDICRKAACWKRMHTVLRNQQRCRIAEGIVGQSGWRERSPCIVVLVGRARAEGGNTVVGMF